MRVSSPASVVIVVLAVGCGRAVHRNAGAGDAAVETASAGGAPGAEGGAGGAVADAAVAGDGQLAAPDAAAADGQLAAPDAAAADGQLVAPDAAIADAGAAAPDAARVWMPGPSCAGLAPTCGPAATSDCCSSSVIPGGTFNRLNDPMWPATVSDFRLDTYEISVGRLRAFVAAYPGSVPAPGSGRNPNDPTDTGWAPSWTPSLPVDAAALRKQLKCDEPGFATWTDSPAANENLAINCIDWFVAQAFCIWDGGRLPTDAEWNYAAAAGSEQRHYPWSIPPTSETVDPSYAVYLTSSTHAPVARVGSRSPLGDGKWGQADLAGNLWELTRDQLDFQAPGLGYLVPCQDCISPVPVTAAPASNVSIRGGGVWSGSPYSDPTGIGTRVRQNIWVTVPEGDIGARCARAP